METVRGLLNLFIALLTSMKLLEWKPRGLSSQFNHCSDLWIHLTSTAVRRYELQKFVNDLQRKHLINSKDTYM